MSFDNFFTKLSEDYYQRNPQAQKINQLLLNEKETLVIDHITFRTCNLRGMDLKQLITFFHHYGYEEKGCYNFPSKKLNAKHLEHKTKEFPKIFISELLIDQCSQKLQTILKKNAPPFIIFDENIFVKNVWQPLSYQIYQEIRQESRYAAWVYAFGFKINHISLDITPLKKFNTIEKINNFLNAQNILLNTFAGSIKGTAKAHLMQSSTEIEASPVNFQEGLYLIPDGDFGFAERFRQNCGEFYTGFVATSADKMFEPN